MFGLCKRDHKCIFPSRAIFIFWVCVWGLFFTNRVMYFNLSCNITISLMSGERKNLRAIFDKKIAMLANRYRALCTKEESTDLHWWTWIIVSLLAAQWHNIGERGVRTCTFINTFIRQMDCNGNLKRKLLSKKIYSCLQRYSLNMGICTHCDVLYIQQKSKSEK